MSIHFEETIYGFNYGAAEVTRCMSDGKAGWVYLDVKTPRDTIRIYVTKTGKVRVWRVGKGEMK